MYPGRKSDGEMGSRWQGKHSCPLRVFRELRRGFNRRNRAVTLFLDARTSLQQPAAATLVLGGGGMSLYIEPDQKPKTRRGAPTSVAAFREHIAPNLNERQAHV